jgi:lipocalin-like protein
MNNFRTMSVTALTALVLVLLHVGDVAAQQKTLKEQLVGTWTFVSSSSKNPDGSSVWGANPKGLLIFTDNGRYSSHILRSDVPHFAAKSRVQGTPDENKAAVHGSIASFGTYTVNEANKSFAVRFEGSSYPNNTGVEQTRPFTLTGDDLKIINPANTASGAQSELVYKRAK